MSFWLPDKAAHVHMRADVDAAIDAMTLVVTTALPSIVAVATLDGARRHTAAALLFRALELLGAARRADAGASAAPVVELACRSIFEISIRGRYLLACDPDNDEFVRMCHYYSDREGKLALASGNPSLGLPRFLEQAIASTKAKQPRNLLDLCAAIDRTEGRARSDEFSAQAGYVVLYQWLSNSAAHAGLSALKRLTIEEGGVLHLNPTPPPLTTAWPIPIVAAFVGELAQAVFTALDLPGADLVATSVSLPGPTPHY
jgi:hypothetical protein